MLSSSSLIDQDVKLRHRNAMTVSATTTSSSSHKDPHNGDNHTEEKSQTKEQFIEDDHCSRKTSDLLSNSLSSVKSSTKRLMQKSHRRQTLSESSDESNSNQVTTIGDCMEYRGKSSGDTMRHSTLQRQTSNSNSGIATAQESSRWRYINLVIEIAIRFLLLYATAKMERTESFKRKIHPEEVWLYKNPMTTDYVPASTALFWIVFAPLVLIISNFLMCRDKKDFKQAFSAFTLALAITAFLTSLLKISVGRPRPDFFYRCFPDGVMGESFDQCTGDKKVIEEGRKSFPSGHSSMTFAAFGFMSFYLASKLHVFNERGRGQSLRLCISLLPMFVALEVAVSRTCDYHHHWQDVLVGSLIGICVSYLTYRQYFPSIFARNCHRAYSPRGGIAANQINCFVGSVANSAATDETDENQPLIGNNEKENKWI